MSLRAPKEHENGLYSQNMLPSRFVILAHAGIQVTDSVRHTVEKRYPSG